MVWLSAGSGQVFQAHSFAIRSLPRRAPKVSVTRRGDSLCQKGCYPMAVLFLVLVFCALVSLGVCDSEIKRAGGRALSLSSRPPAVERVRPREGGRGEGELFTVRADSVLDRGPLQGRSCRTVAISFKPWATSFWRANGFRRAFSCFRSCLVFALTSALAKTRATGVCALP